MPPAATMRMPLPRRAPGHAPAVGRAAAHAASLGAPSRKHYLVCSMSASPTTHPLSDAHFPPPSGLQCWVEGWSERPATTPWARCIRQTDITPATTQSTTLVHFCGCMVGRPPSAKAGHCQGRPSAEVIAYAQVLKNREGKATRARCAHVPPCATASEGGATRCASSQGKRSKTHE